MQRAEGVSCISPRTENCSTVSALEICNSKFDDLVQDLAYLGSPRETFKSRGVLPKVQCRPDPSPTDPAGSVLPPGHVGLGRRRQSMALLVVLLFAPCRPPVNASGVHRPVTEAERRQAVWTTESPTGRSPSGGNASFAVTQPASLSGSSGS
jgi:hypothetical protein